MAHTSNSHSPTPHLCHASFLSLRGAATTIALLLADEGHCSAEVPCLHTAFHTIHKVGQFDSLIWVEIRRKSRDVARTQRLRASSY